MTRNGRGLVVVTGASSGIGAATAAHLAGRGYRVVAGVRTTDDAVRLRASQPGLVQPHRLDVTSPSDVADLADAVERDEQPLVGLVNNAGIAVAGPIELLDIEDWRRQLDVNLLGQVAVTRALLPQLRHSRGRVVNVSSISGRVAPPVFGAYAASKYALEGFTDGLRREVRRFGIHVCAVEPGIVATPIWAKAVAEAVARTADVDAGAVSGYAPMIARTRALASWSTKHGLAPATVAAVVATALTADRPRPRYVVGLDARLQSAGARLLPDRAMDALLRLVFR